MAVSVGGIGVAWFLYPAREQNKQRFSYLLAAAMWHASHLQWLAGGGPCCTLSKGADVSEHRGTGCVHPADSLQVRVVTLCHRRAEKPGRSTPLSS